MLYLINILLALSNLAGLIVLASNVSGVAKILTLNAMFASTLYHLSERKHALPGIYPFNKVTGKLLWYDRVAAYSLIAFLIYTVKDWYTIVRYGILPLAILGISELQTRPLYFCLLHLTWHLLAYYTAAKFLV